MNPIAERALSRSFDWSLVHRSNPGCLSVKSFLPSIMAWVRPLPGR